MCLFLFVLPISFLLLFAVDYELLSFSDWHSLWVSYHDQEPNFGPQLTTKYHLEGGWDASLENTDFLPLPPRRLNLLTIP